jgi:hypothetical protein
MNHATPRLTAPAHLWQRPDMHHALIDRDYATILRLFIRWTPGASQTTVGQAVGYSQGRISEIMHGKRHVTAHRKILDIADGLQMPPAARRLLGLDPRPSTDNRRPSRPQPIGDHEEELRERLTAARAVDATTAALLHEQTDTIRILDRSLGAPAVTDHLHGHLRSVDALLTYGPLPSARPPLARVLGDAAALAGWQALDAGATHRAWQLFERATAAARESGDTALLAFAHAEQAYVLADLGDPGQARTLVAEVHATHRHRIPARLRAWLYAAEADMSAAMGDGAACRRALDRAQHAIPDHDHDPDLPFLSLNAAHLHRWCGHCLARLGDPAAIDALTRALTTMDTAFTRAEAGLRCDLALALSLRGDLDAARSHATRACELATRTGSTRQRRRLDTLRQTLDTTPDRHHRP